MVRPGDCAKIRHSSDCVRVPIYIKMVFVRLVAFCCLLVENYTFLLKCYTFTLICILFRKKYCVYEKYFIPLFQSSLLSM